MARGFLTTGLTLPEPQLDDELLGRLRACAGRPELFALKGSDIKIASLAKDVHCKSRCRLGASTHKGTTVMRATSAGDLYFDERAGKSFVFKLRLDCTRGAGRSSSARSG